MVLGWGSAEDIQLLVGGGQLEERSLKWTLLVRRRHSSCQTLPQPPSLLPSLVLPGPGREHGPNGGSQTAQHLFAAAGRITALSCGERDGAALPERGLCGTERPPSDANARRSTLPAVTSALPGYGYKPWAGGTTQPHAACCSGSLSIVLHRYHSTETRVL